MAVSSPYILATPRTDVILKILPVIARGIDDNTITDFISRLPSKMNAYIIDRVSKDIIDLRPLHSNATSNDPFGVFNINPSLSIGIPSIFARPADVTADIVWTGGATVSTNGTGIANNNNVIGKLIFLVNFHPYIYSNMPEIVITKDSPDMNLITYMTATPCNIKPIRNTISPF